MPTVPKPTSPTRPGAQRLLAEQPHAEHQAIALQLPDAARVAGVSVRTLYTLNGRGELAFIKVGRRTLVRRRDLEAYLDARETVTYGGEGA
jgi:excisionase family DNA binding protein